MRVTGTNPRAIAIAVCAITLTSLLPQPTRGDTRERVQVKIGKPSVWSLAQAHYLLARMHKQNAATHIDPISPTALDPNAPNATRLQILRTVLGIQAEFNQKVGAENQSKLREEQVKLKRRADAQVELAAKEEELRAEKARLNGLKKQLAVLQETDRQREEERKAQSDAESKRDSSGKITEQKFIPLTEDDENRKIEIVKVQQRVNAQQAKVDGLTTEVATLNTQANVDVEPPSLTDTTLTEGTTALPSPSTSLQTLIDKTLAGAGKPSVAASIALDNYIGMQYEIIAKQLTLLRDEIGPDKRVIFLELPASIYTVPCKSEDYVVQVNWKVSEYYYDAKLAKSSFHEQLVERTTLQKMKSAYNKVTVESSRDFQESQAVSGWVRVDDDDVSRAIDVIPRQSALNVNDFHATVSQKNFLGVLKLLSGFGVKVDYQRQRELYEEFLQQEVFASGFGKGRQDFGWTFGPLPGTNRIAPGQRTTYAVLAVPSTASSIRLEGNAIAYKRTKTPLDDFTGVRVGTGQHIAEESFFISIPNEQTEGFDVRSIAYTPVQIGSPVTTVLGGEYFSPQINVLVENTPLTRVLDFGTGEKKEISSAETNSKIKGFFELVNSKEMILTFDMGDPNFVGTPNITLVTPDKTSSINFFSVKINYHDNDISLRDISLTEPMFMKPFALTALELQPDGKAGGVEYLKARLTGTGLRRRAEIWVNDRLIPFDDGNPFRRVPQEYAKQESTTGYVIRFKKEGGPVWNVRFRQKTVRGFEEGSLTHQFPVAPKPFEIRHYVANASGTNAEVDVRFFDTVPIGFKKEENEEIKKVTVKRVEIHPNEGTYPKVEGCVPHRRYADDRPCGQFEEDEKKYRARFSVFPYILGSHKADRDTITVTVFKAVVKEVTKPDKTKELVTVFDFKEVLDISLPIRPQITRVANADTGKPAGFADQEVNVLVEGVNLEAIKKVFFGTQQAEVIGYTDNDSAIVKVPKLANLPKGESVTVPITLEMKSDFYEGKTLTSGYYKYVGQPLPLDVGEPVPVVVRPPRYKGKQSKGGGN